MYQINSPTRKIRTISLDTDVISDLIFYDILERKTKPSKEERQYLEICEESFETVLILLSVRVKINGIKVIRKELEKSGFEELYKKIFIHSEVGIDKEIRNLAKTYIRESEIKDADALILASVSCGNIDIFLSRNRRHMLNPKFQSAIRKINNNRGKRTPLIISPSTFLEHIFLSDKNTICYSRLQLPKEFRPQISFPR